MVLVFGTLAHMVLHQAFRYVLSIGLDDVFAAFAVLLVIALLLMGEDVLELVGMSPLDAQAVAEKYRDEALEQQARLARIV